MINSYDDLQPQANDSAVLNYTEAEQARTDALAMNPNVKITTGNGRTYMTVSETQPLDVDVTLADRIEQSAQDFNRSQAIAHESAVIDADVNYSNMTPTEKRIFIERKYIPLIEELSEVHRDACDAVEDYQSGEAVFKALQARNWAFEGKHKDVKRHITSGTFHLNHLLTSNVLTADGYKLAEVRGSVALCIPDSVQNLQAYETSPEALEYAESVYKHGLDRLLQKRDAAAIQKVTVEREAKAKWDAIRDITSYFSKVKSSSK